MFCYVYTLHMLSEHMLLSASIISISFWWTILKSFSLFFGIYSSRLLSAVTLRWENTLEILWISRHWSDFHQACTFPLSAYDGPHPTASLTRWTSSDFPSTWFTQHLSVCVWHTSRHRVISISICLSEDGRASFPLWLVSTFWGLCTAFSAPIRQVICTGCFHLPLVMNWVSLSMGRSCFFDILISFPLSIYIPLWD